MRVLNCTHGKPEPVVFGKKKETYKFTNLWCSKCQRYGDHLTHECKKKEDNLEAPIIIYYCGTCSLKIPDERVRGLITLGIKEDDFNCYDCAARINFRTKGLYENGVFKVVKQVGRELSLENSRMDEDGGFNTSVEDGYAG